MTTPESFPQPPPENNPVNPNNQSYPPTGYPGTNYPQPGQPTPGYPSPQYAQQAQYPGYAQQFAPPAQGSTINIGLLASLVAGLVVVVAAFLPWVKLGPYSKAGIDGDGAITLGLAVAAGVLAILGLVIGRGMAKGAGITIIVMGALVSLIGIIDVVDVADAVGQFETIGGYDSSVGFGVILTLIGGLALLGSGILALILGTKRPQ